MANRALTWGGGLLAAGAGYYLYQAGGDPKAAEKRFEADLHKANNKLEQPVTPKSSQVTKDAQVVKADAEAKGSQLSAQAKDAAEKAQGRLSELAHSAEKKVDQGSKEFVNAADTFDKKVYEAQREAKSGISGWFGSSK